MKTIWSFDHYEGLEAEVFHIIWMRKGHRTYLAIRLSDEEYQALLSTASIEMM